MAVSAIPAGYHSLTPYIFVRGATEAIKFYTAAFGATDVLSLPMPDGTIAHAEMKIGDSIFMFSDENPAWGNKGPQTLGGYSGGMCIYLPDVDKAFAKAIAAGAKELRPVMDQFYGDRSGSLIDPFGHMWTLATHIEDVPHEEYAPRMAKWLSEMKM
jgi:PhnB protein